MAKEILMPRQGNTVESCIIISWKKKEGEAVKIGEPICEVETDKAAFDVESTADGVLLKTLFAEGEDVPVLTPIAIVGDAGEDVKYLTANKTQKSFVSSDKKSEGQKKDKIESISIPTEIKGTAATNEGNAISPRAKNKALKSGVDLSKTNGTGPDGRIIERDIDRYLSENEPLTPAAMEIKNKSGLSAPSSGGGIGGRVLSTDLGAGQNIAGDNAPLDYEEISVKGVRKVISEKMLNSIQNTAQLTLNASANAVQILGMRNRFKKAVNNEELKSISINDLILYAAAKTLVNHKEVNAHFYNEKIVIFYGVNLGFAVDTPKGLMVPVIKNADKLSLKDISRETKRLGKACNEGKILPDELSGATFTITNLGALGIESFTPVLNPPEVGILGVCSVQIKPVMVDNKVDFIPHIGLSLTFNHQALDGAPAARFLQDVSKAIENVDLLLID